MFREMEYHPLCVVVGKEKKLRNNERNVSQTNTYLDLNVKIYFVHSVGLG